MQLFAVSTPSCRTCCPWNWATCWRLRNRMAVSYFHGTTYKSLKQIIDFVLCILRVVSGIKRSRRYSQGKYCSRDVRACDVSEMKYSLLLFSRFWSFTDRDFLLILLQQGIFPACYVRVQPTSNGHRYIVQFHFLKMFVPPTIVHFEFLWFHCYPIFIFFSFLNMRGISN